jgi:hypothetical protein
MALVGRWLLPAALAGTALLSPLAFQLARAEAPQASALLASEAEGIIFERQQIMLQLDKDAELLGKIMAGLEPATKLAEVTQAVAPGGAGTR